MIVNFITLTFYNIITFYNINTSIDGMHWTNKLKQPKRLWEYNHNNGIVIKKLFYRPLIGWIVLKKQLHQTNHLHGHLHKK
jgi:hypothetical protein